MSSNDYFLKIEGVPGESTDHMHQNEIDVLSFSWGVSQQGTAHMGGGMGAGKASLQDFHFTMKISKASVPLFLACATGRHIHEAWFYVREAGGKQQEYLKVKFTDLLVSSFTTGGQGGVDLKPVDSISLNFSRIELFYRPQLPSGELGNPVNGGYDQKVNHMI